MELQEQDLHDISLREALRAASAAAAVVAQTPSPINGHQQLPDHMHQGPPESPRNDNIDPAIAGSSYEPSGGDSGGDDAEGKKDGGAKRELSTSKRAAQNRAAQRAFRQRKEGYIKKLEDQVRDRNALEESYKAIQAENYQLRDYVINLQSRLIESQGDYPQPPPQIDLRDPRAGEHLQQMTAPTATMASSAVSQLQAAAAAVAAEDNAGAVKQSQEDAYMADATPYGARRTKPDDVLHSEGEAEHSGHV